jgi:AraC-like DNA-binding protein/quercetin dioxygenase-like cupin family protein
MTDGQTALDRLRRTVLEQTIAIPKIITMYYFEYGTDYVFPGERHDFWEFLYVDRGEIEVMADDARHVLTQGMIIFHRPNEYHRFRAARGKAPNLIVMTFECRSKAMQRFRGRVCRLNPAEHQLLARIVQEGMNAFEFPFRHPLVRRPDAPIGSEQLLRCYLEAFLIHLLRKEDAAGPDAADAEPSALSSPAQSANRELASRVIRYMDERLDRPVSLDDICRAFHISKTRLQQLFKQATGETVMAYAAKRRIERAKVMIRENADNVTEIARKLGFSSVHYFSRAFKRATRMSPSEYARTVKVRLRTAQERGDGGEPPA